MKRSLSIFLIHIYLDSEKDMGEDNSAFLWSIIEVIIYYDHKFVPLDFA